MAKKKANAKGRSGRQANRKGTRRRMISRSVLQAPQARVRDEKLDPQAMLTALISAVRANPDDVGTRLTLGEFCLHHGHHDRILEAIDPVEERYPLSDANDNSRYDRLRCLGLAQAQRLVEAERVASRGQGANGDNLDYWWCLAYVHLSMREHAAAIEASRAYLKELESIHREKRTVAAYCGSSGHLAQLHNFLGSALMETGREEEAIAAFGESARHDPGSQYPYLNLVNLHRRRGEADMARKALAKGLKKAREVQELRLLEETLEKSARISACMIVRNEEELLPGCLESIRDIVDEIIVVDTGSTDGTVEVAKSYGAKVLHQPWEGDFSKHRNYSLEQATGDWVLVIDADERLSQESCAGLTALVNDPASAILQVNVVNHYPSGQHRFTLLKSMRLWRRELNLQYTGIVHNQVEAPQHVAVTSTPLRIDHLGYSLSPKHMQAKFERTYGLLRKQVAEEPENGFAWFNLAQVLRPRLLDDLDKYAPEFTEAAHKALAFTSAKDDRQRNTHLMALDQLAWVSFYRGEYAQAREWVNRALEIKPDYLDPLMLAGHIHSKQQEYEEAIRAYQRYLDAQRGFAANPQVDTPMLYHPDSRATALFGMGLAAEMSGDSSAAREYYARAVEVNPEYLDVAAHLGRLYLADDDVERAERLFRDQLAGDHPSAVAALGLGDICSQRGQYDQAAGWYRQAVELSPDDFSARLSLARSLFRAGRQDDFAAVLKESLEKRSRDEAAYIAAARMLQQLGDLDGAGNIIEQGMRNAVGTHGLEALRDQMVSRPTVSACMIVKNEEELLAGCLESIRDWVDEIIIVDTGSEDRTVEIAESYGARVFHQPWEGDFSKHRNYSIEQACCDWIFIIDADERFELEGLADVRRTLKNPNISIISINVFNVYGQKSEVTTFLPSVRFWRRNLNLRYDGIVHNVLQLGQNPVYRLGARIRHLGYDLSPGKMKAKHERTRGLLEKQLAENPDNPFALFNYAQVLRTQDGAFARHAIPDILRAAGRAIELTDPEHKSQRHIHLMCLEQVATCYYYQKEFEKVIEVCDRALRLKPDYLDPLMIRANALFKLGRYDEARTAYEKYLEVQAAYDPGTERDPIILTHIDARAAAHYGLAALANNAGERARARQHYEQALRAWDGFQDAYSRLGRLYFDDGDFTQARKHFLKQMETSYKTMEALLGLAIIYKETNMPDNAEEYYRMAMQLDEFDPEPCAKYARFLLEQGRVDEAKEAVELAIRKDSHKVRAYTEASQLYAQFGHHELAAVCLQCLRDEVGDQADSINDLANCYYQQQNYERAADLYDQATRLPEAKPVTWRNLGLALYHLGRNRESIEALETYLRKRPDDLDIAHVAGDLYSKVGQHSQALEKYEKYLSKRPLDVLAMFNLSECYLFMGHTDSAVMGYKRVLQIDPGFQPALKRLSDVLEPAGQP